MAYLYALVVLSLLGGGLAVLLLIADRYLANYGPCEITVNDKEPFIIEGGDSVLNALYEQKIFIPSACGGQGTCGFCKVNILEGGGPLLPTETPYLSKDEIALHTRLACRVKVKENVIVNVRPEFLDVKEFLATVTETRMVTPDTRHLSLKLIEPEEIDFHPGQYLQIKVPSKKSETIMRAYSISSLPSNKNEVELVVRLIPNGLGSTYLHNVQVGEEVTFTGAYGEFILDENVGTELICVGGGCGIAPMRSIIRHIHQMHPQRKCSLFFGARTAEDVMYLEEFERIAETMPNFKIHYALSEPQHSPEWKGETGFIHESVIKHIGTEGARQVFLCGPPLMIEATTKVLTDKNISNESIFYDEF